MKTYNYLEAVTSDVKDYILRNFNKDELKQELNDRENFEENLHDEMWDQDCITGNGEWGYNISKKTAETYIGQNLDLAGEVMEEFSITLKMIKEGYRFTKGANYLDTAIRCYVLREAVSNAVTEIISENPNLEAENIQ